MPRPRHSATSVGRETWPDGATLNWTLLVEQAIVDAYDEYEQHASFHVVIEEHQAVPFQTTVLGDEATATKIDLLSGSGIAAICSRRRRTRHLDR